MFIRNDKFAEAAVRGALQDDTREPSGLEKLAALQIESAEEPSKKCPSCNATLECDEVESVYHCPQCASSWWPDELD